MAIATKPKINIAENNLGDDRKISTSISKAIARKAIGTMNAPTPTSGMEGTMTIGMLSNVPKLSD